VRLTSSADGVFTRIISRAAWDRTSPGTYTLQPLEQPTQTFQSYQQTQTDDITVTTVPSIVNVESLPTTGAEQSVNVAVTAPPALTIKPDGQINSGVIGVPYLSFNMQQPLGTSGAPAVVMLDVDIESTDGLVINPNESYTFDVSGLLSAASVLTGMTVRRGTNYRRITIAFVGALLTAVFPAKSVRLDFSVWNNGPIGGTGGKLVTSMTATVFGQQVVTAVVAIPRQRAAKAPPELEPPPESEASY